MSHGSKRFVALVFILLGASFWLSTGALIFEFRDIDWQTLLFAHSHLFIFFPLFGTLTLAAFYTPSVALTDFYWRFVTPGGRVRFVLGFLVVASTAATLTYSYSLEPRRAVWEISPAALVADQTATHPPVEGCQAGQRLSGILRETVREIVRELTGREADPARQSCNRRPILVTLQELRQHATIRGSLSEFARSCKPDPLVEGPQWDGALRYCFPAGQVLTTANCCLAQKRFEADVRELALTPAHRSITSRVEEVALLGKAFFVIVLGVVGFLLAIWQDKIAVRYADHFEDIVRWVIYGTIIILIWPLMDYSYQLISDVLFGRNYRGIPFRITLYFMLAIISLLFINAIFFIRRASGMLPSIGTIGTVIGPVASAMVWLSYDAISNFGTWTVGAGTTVFKLWLLLAAAFVGLIFTAGPYKYSLGLVVPGQAPDGKSPPRSPEVVPTTPYLPLT